MLVYAKDEDVWRPNPMQRSEGQDKIYKNADNDPRGSWRPDNLSARNSYSLGLYAVTTPGGRVIEGPPAGRFWAVSKEKLEALDRDNRIWWGKDGNNVPSLKRFISEVKQGRVPQTYWSYEEVGHTQDAKKESVLLYGEQAFATPKPEALMQRVVEIASNQGDLVLDSFAGSGTTGAVAHKMGRRWIMVELGEHCHTHIIPRLQKVIAGQDRGGITEAVGWKGGGGFRYYRLAPSLLERDRWGNWVISREYDAPMLTQALCRLQGFTYAPSEVHWWQHGHASERDFICVTTQSLSAAQLQALAEDVGPQRSLVLLCAAWHGVTAAQAADRWPNLTLKKIPKTVLHSCEWGHDDYSLNVANLPIAQPDAPAAGPTGRGARRAGAAAESGQTPLFGEEGS